MRMQMRQNTNEIEREGKHDDENGKGMLLRKDMQSRSMNERHRIEN